MQSSIKLLADAVRNWASGIHHVGLSARQVLSALADGTEGLHFSAFFITVINLSSQQNSILRENIFPILTRFKYMTPCHLKQCDTGTLQIWSKCARCTRSLAARTAIRR